jgi:hypothetical protein
MSCLVVFGDRRRNARFWGPIRKPAYSTTGSDKREYENTILMNWYRPKHA